MPLRAVIATRLKGMLLSLLTLTGALGVATTAGVAGPSASGWQGIPEAEVRLIAGRTADGDEMIGLDFVIAPKWKVYWRSPGDAGFPPVADWSGSDGVVPGDMAWPLPRRFIYYGMRTYGYEEQLVLPVTIRDRERTRPTVVKLHLSYAACADICVPVEVDLELALPAGDLPRNRHGRAIARARGAAPEIVPGALRSARISRVAGAPSRLVLDVTLLAPVRDPDVIIEGRTGLVFGEAECGVERGTALRCTATVDGPDETIAAQRGQMVTVTVFGDGPAIEATGLVSTAD